MVLCIQIAKFKFTDTNWEPFSPNLMLVKVTHYAVCDNSASGSMLKALFNNVDTQCYYDNVCVFE